MSGLSQEKEVLERKIKEMMEKEAESKSQAVDPEK